MFKKSILAAALTLTPLSSGVGAINTANNQTIKVNEQETTETEACSVMYIGKKCTKSGRALFARSADASPTGMNLNVQIFEHNELANKVIEGKNGFKWTMPSTTYRYISTPRNPKVHKGLHWEVSGINEMGVACSATLSCYTNKNALAADKFVSTGITEDNIAQIVTASAKTAREGIEILANIMDTEGSNESNIILVGDANETWLMEMYTGHQYVAVKMPDDKICTIGNEFILDNLKDYPTHITSPKYYELPKEKKFAKYDGEEKEENLNLYNTYAGDGEGVQGKFTDGCHMRTWIGHYRFGSSAERAKVKQYEPQTKYSAFFDPINKQMGVEDVISYMRDRFEIVTENPDDPNYAYFTSLPSLRSVATPTTYQVHIIEIDPNMPKENSITEWMCLSNSSYAPFVPISNGATNFNEYYTHCTEDYSFDQNSAVCVYKRLNRLAEIDRKYIGKPVEKYICDHELALMQQYANVMNDIKDLSSDKQSQVLTNYSCEVQKYSLLMSNHLYEDVLWYIINNYKIDPTKTQVFTPYASLEYYSWLYGWDYSYNKDTKIATVKKGARTYRFDLNYLWDKKGKLIDQYDNETPIYVQIKDGVPYAEYDVCKSVMYDANGPVKVDINDYMNKKSKANLALIIPLAIGLPIALGASILAPLLIMNKNKKVKSHKSK